MQMDASSLNQILHSFEIRDDRMSLAEGEMKRLNESFLRLREDLLPIFRMVKESKPLPTPDLPLHVRSNSPPVPSALSPSPTYYSTPSVATPQLIRKASKKNLTHHAPTSAHSPSRNSHDWLDTTSFYGTSGSVPKDSRKAGTAYNTASAGYGNGQYSSSSSMKRQNSTGSTHHPDYSSTSVSTPSLSSSASMISVATSSTARTITPTLVSTSGSIPSNASARNVTPTLASTAARSISSSNLSTQSSLKMSSNPAGMSGLVSNGSTVSLASNAGVPGGGSSTSSYVSLAGSKHSEPIKDFNISPDVPCYKVLPLIARRHKVRGDWRGVGLVVCYDDQERMIGLEEKPLAIYKELQQRGKNPIFMIREDNGLKTDSGFVVNGTPGGLL